MKFYNETWFWTGCFSLLGSLGVVLIQEFIRARTQTKLERIRQHESATLIAYEQLYRFISHAQGMLWPPSNPRRDFLDMMRNDYFKHVKPKMLLYTSEIRKLLQEFEGQYDCLGDPDLNPKIPFDEFVSKHAIKHLRALSTAVEKCNDAIRHKNL